MKYFLAIVSLFLFVLPLAAGDQHQGCTHHKSDLDHRGEMVMGFEQGKATHHFLQADDGGSISIEAKEADSAVISEIRMHLQMVQKSFAGGDFQIPHEIHQQIAPGSEKMSELQNEISYKYEELPKGGRVKISSANANAVDAVHEFLKFQIREHKTGDPM